MTSTIKVVSKLASTGMGQFFISDPPGLISSWYRTLTVVIHVFIAQWPWLGTSFALQEDISKLQHSSLGKTMSWGCGLRYGRWGTSVALGMAPVWKGWCAFPSMHDIYNYLQTTHI